MKWWGAIVAIILWPVGVAAAEVIKLPVPDTTGGVPLMQALTARRSTREFSAKSIEAQDLSNILYAAWGISHEDKRTIPTARNLQKMRVFAARKDGVWEYDAAAGLLRRITEQDITDLLATQDFVKEAPLNLIYVDSDAKFGTMDAGAAYQNVGLYCASAGLNNVVRHNFDHAGVAEVLGVSEAEVIISQTIGWPHM